MKTYLDALRYIMVNGVRQSNRTGIDTITVPGMALDFDLREGFPAPTTKKLAWKQVKAELRAFLEGTSSLARFQELGCTVWDANVAAPAWQNNPACKGPDDMGRIYGVQWRDWQGGVIDAQPTFTGRTEDHLTGVVDIKRESIDQIAVALDLVRNNPENRRIIVNSWNAADINKAALPPCHVMFQLLPHVDSKVLNMTMYQRSCDMFLGVPFNIASYALLLELFSWWTGYKAGKLTMFLADAHIYVNHFNQVQEQLSREPMAPPRLWIESMAGPTIVESNPIDVLIKSLDHDKWHLLDYAPMDAIKAPMAV